MRRLLPALLALVLLTACTQGTDWRSGQMGEGWKVLSQRVSSMDAADGGYARVVTVHLYMDPPVTAERLEQALSQLLRHIRHRRYAHASIYVSDTLVPIPVLYNIAAVYFHPSGTNTFNRLSARPDYTGYELDLNGVRSHVYQNPDRPRPTDEELIFVTVLHRIRQGTGDGVSRREAQLFETFVAAKESEELAEIENRVWLWLMS